MTYIIYTKSGCENCLKAKALLSTLETVIINCDQFIKHNRNEFIKSIELKTHEPFKQFPIIFYGDDYIGGYYDLLDYLNFELIEDF